MNALVKLASDVRPCIKGLVKFFRCCCVKETQRVNEALNSATLRQYLYIKRPPNIIATAS